MDKRELFWDLYKAPVEGEVDKILKRHGFLQDAEVWRPYGQNENNFSVVENQQASPIPALIEKITNGIDAIMMRACIEQRIDPRADVAPGSIDEALKRFFPNHGNWDLPRNRRQQAERLQILAHGPRFETSLVVYDDGEGQTPREFEKTFLSLIRGNKNDIHFVQGKYNMGGSGAVAFCGKRRYQLICSRRFNGRSPFGFTLVRRHPLTIEEEKRKKATWYEYLVLDSAIPSFESGELDLGLYNRKFSTGTVIKLYSYDLPSGSRSVISRDLNQSINEYLFYPALPIFTIDREDRYPDDRNLQRELYGLKRRLEEDDSKYVDQFFSENVDDDETGCLRITCYVFKPRANERSAKETRDTIRREFFKNRMSVLFSVNGQVHGHYTSEFITRSLKLPLLKDYLLIHVDCTEVRTEVRNELFMASRDRLKEGAESRKLRRKLADVLANGRLKEINKERKASITVESKDAEELVKNLTRHLPIRSELADLLSQTFKVDATHKGRRLQKSRKSKQIDGDKGPAFHPKRYPTFFTIDAKPKAGEEIPMVGLPLRGRRTIQFSTDVEDHYFDRIQDPGELQIGLLEPGPNDGQGGDKPGIPRSVATILNVVRSSPSKGKIRVQVRPSKDAKVGDVIKLRASLSSPEKLLSAVFFVKVTEPAQDNKRKAKEVQPDTSLGLPSLQMVYKDARPEKLTWDQLEAQGIPMSHEDVVHPLIEKDALHTVYINMNSTALLSYRTKLTKEETLEVAEKRYVSAVYFHTLFLYTITKNRKYQFRRENGEMDEPVEVTDYISDLFKTFYAQFLLNFDTQELIAALEA